MANQAVPFSFAGYHPVRRASAVDFFVDGEESFAAIAAAIEAAKKSVFITVAFGSLNFRLRPPGQEQLLDLCARVSKRGVKVALLFWQSFSDQTHRDDKGGTITISEQKAIHAKAPGVLTRWDASRNQYTLLPSAGCHHQKSFVIDESVAFVGGLNMTQEYWDTTAHAADDERRVNYDIQDSRRRTTQARSRGSLPLHDVYCRFNGPAVADVARNFVDRWNGATYKVPGSPNLIAAPPAADPKSNIRIQVVRTIAPGQYNQMSGGEYSIKEVMLRLINSARVGIYFENQYFFHTEVVNALGAAAERGVRVVGLLTRRPDAGSFTGFAADQLGQKGQSKVIQYLLGRLPGLRIYCPFTRGAGGLKDIYVHSKTMIADDLHVLVGSANISTTSLEHHSELDVIVEDAARATALRRRLWAEHLHLPAAQLPASFAQGADLWAAHAQDNLERARKKLQLRSRVLPLRDVIGGSELGGEDLEERLFDDPMRDPITQPGSDEED